MSAKPREAKGQDQFTTPQNRTPNADMQAEDAGTADSGVASDREDASKAMKQTSKTEAEAGPGKQRERGGKDR